jgi:hypothetical protein
MFHFLKIFCGLLVSGLAIWQFLVSYAYYHFNDIPKATYALLMSALLYMVLTNTVLLHK